MSKLTTAELLASSNGVLGAIDRLLMFDSLSVKLERVLTNNGMSPGGRVTDFDVEDVPECYKSHIQTDYKGNPFVSVQVPHTNECHAWTPYTPEYGHGQMNRECEDAVENGPFTARFNPARSHCRYDTYIHRALIKEHEEYDPLFLLNFVRPDLKDLYEEITPL